MHLAGSSLLYATLFAMLLAIATSLQAIEPPRSTLTGRIAETDELYQLARQKLGDYGILSIRSAERWGQIEQELVALGWQKPAEGPHVAIDFSKQMLVLIYKNGDHQDQFSVHSYDDKAAQLGVAMSYVIYKKAGHPRYRCNFLLTAVPLAAKLEVTVATYHPHNGGTYETPDKARPEWRGFVGSDAGDVVDGLRGQIQLEPVDAVRKGDIILRFTLEFVGGALVKGGAFASQTDLAYVWDGKYSSGYRNHAFLVRTPDGKSHFLQPKEIPDWSKNAPHPVAVTAKSPYVLPNWVEAQRGKSLLDLGLSATDPGEYSITGIYTERGGMGVLRAAEVPMWGGNLATNTLVYKK